MSTGQVRRTRPGPLSKGVPSAMGRKLGPNFGQAGIAYSRSLDDETKIIRLGAHPLIDTGVAKT